MAHKSKKKAKKKAKKKETKPMKAAVQDDYVRRVLLDPYTEC